VSCSVESDADKKQRLFEIASAAVAAFLVFVLFHFWGNRSNLGMAPPSLFVWIGQQWMADGGDFSHGWIMPLVSIGVIWMKRKELAAARDKQSYLGLMVLLASLALHWAALRAQQPRVSLAAFVGVIWSIPFFLYGRKVAGLLLFPAGYLLLCFTSYLLISFTMPLRLASCAASCGLLNGIGISSVRHGTAIYSAAAGGFNFDVADPCSGLRSLVVMTALAAPYAYFTQKNQIKRWVLFLSSIPLAMMANIFRIVTIAVAAEIFGKKFALTAYHDYSDFFIFAAAILMMAAVGNYLGRIKPREAK
jgi:exosortase